MSDFQQGADGTPRYTWAKSQQFSYPWGGWGASASNPYSRYPGQRSAAEAAAAADVASELLTSNPTLSAIVEALAINGIGNGLTPSMRIDPASINSTPDETRALDADILKQWQTYCNNPLEVDLSGRHNLHGLATAFYKSYIVSGEGLAVLDHRQCPGAKSMTKVSLLDSRQLDRRKNQTSIGGAGISNGVQFDAETGRLTGYWLSAQIPGQLNTAPTSTYVAAWTPWGRTVVIHRFDIVLPGQVRGMSPMISALGPSHEANALQEATLAAAMLGTELAITVTSDLPPGVAADNISAGNEFAPNRWGTQDYADYYEKNQIKTGPGQINFLPPNNKMTFNTAEAPAGNYEAFNSALVRSAAKAAGAMTEDVSGDYSKTSFSASRMASELPNRINERRRAQIIVPFYQLIFEAWLEEYCERGFVKLPPNAPAFWQAKEIYTTVKWTGSGRAYPDTKKQNEADVMALANNLDTHANILSARGLDLETVYRQRAYERQLAKDLGLPVDDVGNLTTQVRIAEQEPAPDEDDPNDILNIHPREEEDQ